MSANRINRHLPFHQVLNLAKPQLCGHVLRAWLSPWCLRSQKQPFSINTKPPHLRLEIMQLFSAPMYGIQAAAAPQRLSHGASPGPAAAAGKAAQLQHSAHSNRSHHQATERLSVAVHAAGVDARTPTPRQRFARTAPGSVPPSPPQAAPPAEPEAPPAALQQAVDNAAEDMDQHPAVRQSREQQQRWPQREPRPQLERVSPSASNNYARLCGVVRGQPNPSGRVMEVALEASHACPVGVLRSWCVPWCNPPPTRSPPPLAACCFVHAAWASATTTQAAAAAPKRRRSPAPQASPGWLAAHPPCYAVPYTCLFRL